MTSERADAYGRVMRTIDELGPAKLLPAEQERIRGAADALFFAEQPVDGPVAEIEALASHLVESGRWTSERVEQLVRDVLECGPLAPAQAA